ncbi:sigma 54-interacting transcriptional regulator [Haliea sp. E1-2-M8]|uniref:sigma 54-interacting transcriptional regulator n=1 Tax=Haliea sp. E1-2-M8 TaxID=3064706 RepID=UPI0027274990|nr:sigma 54-interacting transcriptional regulator [Haliea sp. E1-2-M8]MDO8861424.1 sigma 54-interacting transcriptional regulator [Haliea sp. E1-2-M8]
MPEYSRTDATLPSVFARLAVNQARTARVVTIVFHPDPRRIGERWLVPERSSRALVLGRQQPLFSPAAEGDARPLDDPHVSRQALSLAFNAAGVTIAPLPSACRCRVDGSWVSAAQTLDHAALRRGIALQLAHSVVLLLREQTMPPASAPETSAGAALCGSSFYMQSLRQQIARVADSGLDVLIRGETGSGKELVARALHAHSERRSGPLVAVNMAAIPPGVAPAALFGSVRGAFTGADRNTRGYFQQADGGSLFLDEVGDTSDDVQPQLLRALQEREVQPVGGKLEKVDVRVISATDAALDGQDSNFRSALRHRLGSAEVQVAPLRTHPEDIGELLCHFLNQACAETGRPPPLAEPGADELRVAQWAELFHLCLRHEWPGNVRELANCARQVLLDSDAGIQPPALLLQQSAAAVAEEYPHTDQPAPVELGDAALRALLEQEGYQVAAAARRAGISRQALYRRLPELGLRLAAQVPEAELQRALADSGGDIRAAAMLLRVSTVALRGRLRNRPRDPDAGGGA